MVTYNNNRDNVSVVTNHNGYQLNSRIMLVVKYIKKSMSKS